MRLNLLVALVIALGVLAATSPAIAQTLAEPTTAPAIVDATTAPAAHAAHSEPVHAISLAWSIPFVILLAAIALMPFINKHWWEHKYPYVAIALAAVPLIYYIFIDGDLHPWTHGMKDYVGFIILLGSLYIVSGGIVINVSRKATPLVNCAFLLLGAVAANLFGTTGASMLLIRPFLRVNKAHLKPYHVVFFIFIVSNVGGSLTPIGDPPLFLGYLRGVPFWWVFEHCRQAWLLTVGLLTAIFFVIDTLDHRKAERSHEATDQPAVTMRGPQHFLFIGVIIFAVFQPGIFELIESGKLIMIPLSREILMAVATIISLKTTKPEIHKRNEFTYGPIKEVAILFIGIFSTMAPTLQWLETNADKLPLRTPGQFYYATGSLSAALDNAPTYMTFLQARLSELDPKEVDAVEAHLRALAGKEKLEVDPAIRDTPIGMAVAEVIHEHPERVRAGTVDRAEVELSFLLGVPALNAFMVAISLGAVFFGACTYIGNGPNFMVKSIADAAGANMPSFLEYIYKYSLPILIPVYVIVWAVFLR